MKYHNSGQGPQVCNASIRACPVGGEHYANQEQASEAFGQIMAESHGKLKTLKKAKLGNIGLKKTKRSEVEVLARLQRRKSRKNKAGKIALITASMAMVSACSMSGDSSRWAQTPDQPQESYSASQDVDRPAPAVQGEDKPSLQEDLRDYQGQLQEQLAQLQETYGDDWKENLVSGLNEFLTYAEDFQPPAPDPTESRSEYDREAFKHWSDLDQNNCDTRQDILARDLDNVVMNSDGCIQSGVLQDPFTGKTIYYERGDLSIDVDHTVALSDAWSRGANNWSDDQRELFANDPENLMAVDAGANRSKGDQSPSEWLPINQDSACDYGMQYLKVAKKYDLRIDQADVASVNEACK